MAAKKRRKPTRKLVVTLYREDEVALRKLAAVHGLASDGATIRVALKKALDQAREEAQRG